MSKVKLFINDYKRNNKLIIIYSYAMLYRGCLDLMSHSYMHAIVDVLLEIDFSSHMQDVIRSPF